MSQIILINIKIGFGAHTNEIIEKNFVVYNAPRPIPGAITWTGSFRHGVYYAAGKLEEFEQVWLNLDAWPVQLISNEQIYSLLQEKARSINKDLDAFLAKYPGGISKLADSYHLPWVD